MTSPPGAGANSAGAPVPAASPEATAAGPPADAEKKTPVVTFQEGSAPARGEMQGHTENSSRQVRKTASDRQGRGAAGPTVHLVLTDFIYNYDSSTYLPEGFSAAVRPIPNN